MKVFWWLLSRSLQTVSPAARAAPHRLGVHDVGGRPFRPRTDLVDADPDEDSDQLHLVHNALPAPRHAVLPKDREPVLACDSCLCLSKVFRQFGP